MESVEQFGQLEKNLVRRLNTKEEIELSTILQAQFNDGRESGSKSDDSTTRSIKETALTTSSSSAAVTSPCPQQRGVLQRQHSLLDETDQASPTTQATTGFSPRRKGRPSLQPSSSPERVLASSTTQVSAQSNTLVRKHS